MMNNEFYAVCERATDLMHIAIINKDYGKAELAYFKTLEEAEEFLRNLSAPFKFFYVRIREILKGVKNDKYRTKSLHKI